MEDKLVSRKEVRAMGLNVSSTQFGRWEAAGLLQAHKPGGLRNAHVRYWLSNIHRLLDSRKPKSTGDRS